MSSVVIVAHNLRSTHNVGSILRTADGLGVEKIYLTGYTPYPTVDGDSRLPHLAAKIDKQIAKTALGAEKSVTWEYSDQLESVIKKLKSSDYKVVALEQSPKSIPLDEFKASGRVAVIVGREVEGLEPEVLNLVDTIIEIPMHGQKESFNVAIAAAIAAYYLKKLA